MLGKILKPAVSPTYCHTCKELVNYRTFKEKNYRFYLLECGHWQEYKMY